MCGSHAQSCDSYTVYAVDHVTVHAQDTMQIALSHDLSRDQYI